MESNELAALFENKPDRCEACGGKLYYHGIDPMQPLTHPFLNSENRPLMAHSSSISLSDLFSYKPEYACPFFVIRICDIVQIFIGHVIAVP